MKIVFTKNGWEDFEYWSKNNKNNVKRINLLLEDIIKSPFEGIGKPEALRFNRKGEWSRRITNEHRLIYTINNDVIEVRACRFHYDK